MNRLSLHEHWKLTDTAPHAGDAAALSAAGVDTSGWLGVPVPGDVNAVLVAAGRMPNPHFGDNARQCYWVTGRDWWYRLEFRAEPGVAHHADLCLDGVDGHADVYLNGTRLARLENAFRPYRLDARAALRPGANVLLLRFEAIDAVLGGPRDHELAGWRQRRALMRKPQFSFGWDWSLPLPSIGIAGGVWLECYEGPRLVDVSVEPHVGGRLDFKFRANTAARDAGYELAIRVTGPNDAVGAAVILEQRLGPAHRVFSHTSLQIDSPRLWWPRGMGAQPLYVYEVDLIVDGKVADRRSGRIGIREVRILEEPFTEGQYGISFWLEINGQRVFSKGGNWIPTELWPATATDEQYRFYLQKTVEANFNMQRVWGGGIYERDIFYDLCDELGIMVWQDFMFAGAYYPLDRLRDEIVAEADHQVKRLRNHPCIALWCGCNEDVFSWSLPDEEAWSAPDTGVYSPTSRDAQAARLHDDPQLYSMILRGTVSKLGLGVPYTESSPQSYEDAGNQPESGNCHVSCWKYSLFETDHHPERFRGHFEKVCSFDSEFCIQGPCDQWTLERFLPKDHRWPPDDLWTFHIQRGHANLPHHEQTLMIAGAIFGEIDSLQKYVKYGQATHAEQMRAEFESARRDRPDNGGTMMWMFNDCWPTSNWSIIDYYRRPKPSYYAAKRACATLLPIVFEREGRVEFFFSNDGPDREEVEVVFGQECVLEAGRRRVPSPLGGEGWGAGLNLERERVGTLGSQQTRVVCGPCETVKVFSIERSALSLAPGDYLFVDAIVNGQPLPSVTYFPGLWRDVPWPTPTVDVELLGDERVADGWLTRVKVSTDVFARFCHLRLPEEARPFWLDDNFFDLRAGHSRVIAIQSARRIDVNAIAVGHWWTEWP